MAFLNRQVIVLLENMGVEEHNRSAQNILEQNVRSYEWERMRKSGIQLAKEPFARSLLLLLAQER
jgi:hypothetical protein